MKTNLLMDQVLAHGWLRRLTCIGVAFFVLINTSRQTAVAQKASSAIELLTAVGLDEDVLVALSENDLNSPSAADLQTIGQIASTLRRFDAGDIETWSKPFDATNAQSGQLYRIDGRINQIEEYRISSGNLYRLTIDSSSQASNTLSVWVSEIPNAWLDYVNAPVSLSAGFHGLLLAHPLDQATFASDRISWHPSDSDSGPEVRPGLIELGKLGVDVSLFGKLDHGKKITSNDRECFYQLLAESEKLVSLSKTSRSFDIVRLLQHPSKESGNMYRLNGIARRVTRVPVADADIQRRFAIDHYFEIDMFIPLSPILTLVDDVTGERTTYNDYPVTVCTRSIPNGLSVGPNISQQITIDAISFKLWAYRNELLNTNATDSPKNAKRKRFQRSPLFIGNMPTAISDKVATDARRFADGTGIGLTVLIIAIALVIFITSQREKTLRKRRNSRDPKTIDIPQ